MRSDFFLGQKIDGLKGNEYFDSCMLDFKDSFISNFPEP